MISLDSASVEARFDGTESCWVFGDGLCGPAGVASLELGWAGIVVLADHADPASLVEVLVRRSEMPDLGAAVDAVTALLGRAAAAAMEADSRSSIGDVVALDPTTAATRSRVGRLALLLELREGSADASEWWAAEAAQLAHLADTRVGLGALAGEEAVVGARVLVTAEQWPSPLAARLAALARALLAAGDDADPATTAALRARLEEDDGRATTRGPQLSDADVESRFRQVTADLHLPALEAGGCLQMAGADVRGTPGAEGEPVSATFQVDPSLGPSGPLDSARQGQARWDPSSGVLEVRVPCTTSAFQGSNQPLWVVVWDTRRRLTLAMAILMPDRTGVLEGTWGLARLPLPTDVHLEDLGVSATADARVRPPSASRQGILAAIDAGQGATRGERLGQWEHAADAWEACANLWAVVGDADRQALALAGCAAALERDGDPDGAEAARQRLQRLPITWAAEQLHVARAIPDPFLAELLAQPGAEP